MAASPSKHSEAAVLLGLAVGLRAFSAPGALALRHRPLNWPRRALLLAALGELVADKLPSTPSRLERRGLSARVLSSAISGQLVAGPAGAARAVGAALASAVTGNAVRNRVPGIATALCEDGIAIVLASAGAARAGR
ncbi:MAG TPA: hypothetical protein VK761_03205 [Solirubrobacteraceae bacterium]|jgi:uncharacterized membrane protein|nr:hypothetical protein [Solirubrobacteraceae bacterium]